MSKIKLLTIAFIGLIAINLVLLTFLFLRKPPHPPEGNPLRNNGPKDLIIQELHFDKDQISQYEKLIEAHQNSVKNLQDSIRAAKNELYKSLEDENSANKDSLISRLAFLQKEIELLHYNHFADIKKICKPDQLIYYHELISKLAEFFSPEKRPPPPKRD